MGLRIGNQKNTQQFQINQLNNTSEKLVNGKNK